MSTHDPFMMIEPFPGSRHILGSSIEWETKGTIGRDRLQQIRVKYTFCGMRVTDWRRASTLILILGGVTCDHCLREYTAQYLASSTLGETSGGEMEFRMLPLKK